MKIYIRSTGNISPQNTFGHPAFPAGVVEHTGNRLRALEPDYKNFIDVKLIRRMSRIIKMGVASAMECLQEAAVAVPDAIVTGTAYGCLEDTGVFLSRMVEQKEELLAPTAFIQSTHNTVGAQIALMLHCNGYNNVFVHRGFSFESALLDAIMLLNEGEAKNVLVGGLDEITNHSHAILQRFGIYRKTPACNIDLFKQRSNGTIAGEGAAFFLLTAGASGNDYAQLDGLATFYRPRNFEETVNNIMDFLKSHSVGMEDVDLVINGRNGDSANDAVYDHVAGTAFHNIDSINYKHLCGEYPTSVSFALWLAANIVHTGKLPSNAEGVQSSEKKIKRILIYNHSYTTHHSLLLISAC